MCHFDNTAVAGSGKVGPVNRLTTPWITIVTSSDRPKSVRNRFLETSLCCYVCYDISVGIRAFVI